ncbi:hypothetical protein V6N11_051953 [Hibiscus sabdariffa]|uniref:Uncharacterized protein n=1 Tax=Hibiscus sabdariffa TaxID=183260 RepID=A0ABR2U8Q0_9ROSI
MLTRLETFNLDFLFVVELGVVTPVPGVLVLLRLLVHVASLMSSCGVYMKAYLRIDSMAKLAWHLEGTYTRYLVAPAAVRGLL